MPSDLISRRALGVDASGIRKVFDLAAQLKDPINLSIGLPDFDVPDAVKDAACDAIRRGDNRYTQTQGIAPLRNKVRERLTRSAGPPLCGFAIRSASACETASGGPGARRYGHHSCPFPVAATLCYTAPRHA